MTPDVSVEWARQSEYGVRFGWAVPAVEVMGGDVIVVVDVLRFTTAVEAAVSRGAVVFPYRWRDESAAVIAEAVGARLADGNDPLGPSLSPASLLTMKAGEALVLPSPNGSTCAAAAKASGATVVAACLRNASAVGEWVRSCQGSVSVIACGERWPDGSLRPALEDLLGAGAVLAGLPGQSCVTGHSAVSTRPHTPTAPPAPTDGPAGPLEGADGGQPDRAAGGPGRPGEGETFPVRECLRIVLNEQWCHRLYARRDLAVLAGRA